MNMAEHATPATGQHRQPGWYWVRWTPNGFWFPVQWFRGHDGQEFWVGGGAGSPAAEVGSRIREMGGDQREGYTMRDDTPVDSDTLARRLARRVVSQYTTSTGTYGELLHLENLVANAIVIALNEKKAEIARRKNEITRLKQALDQLYDAIGVVPRGEHWPDYLSRVRKRIAALQERDAEYIRQELCHAEEAIARFEAGIARLRTAIKAVRMDPQPDALDKSDNPDK